MIEKHQREGRDAENNHSDRVCWLLGPSHMTHSWVGVRIVQIIYQDTEHIADRLLDS